MSKAHFHRELVILDKIINDLKSKLPLGKKPQEEDEESGDIEEQSETSQADATSTDISDISAEEEEAPENNSLVYKLKKKLQGLQKKGASSAEGADDEDAAKKKKRSKILQYAIGGGLVLFLASDYIIPTDEAPAPEIKLKPRKRPKKVSKTEEKPADTAATPAETKPEETAAATTETPAPTEVAGTETAPTTETPATTIETSPDSPVTVESVDVPTDTTTPAIETPPTETTETPMVAVPDTTITEPAITEPAITEPTVGDTTPTLDSVDGNETGKVDENITDQILQDLEKQAKGSTAPVVRKEYVSPPDYEYRGRGLVYNCSGKHWACVDGPSYKTCEDNSSSVSYLKKKTECHPFNIYETARGCESMQNRMVSSSAKTEFCN